MNHFTHINENICRMTMPYKDIFTTIYTVRTPKGVLLFDAASYDEDVEMYILPFLKYAGVRAEELKYIFISHNHTDHAGGLKALLEVFPKVTVISRSDNLKERFVNCISREDGDILLDVLKVVTIPGHTMDSAAIFDSRTKTLISGDCLQSYGLRGSGDWASNIPFPAEHIEAINKLRTLDIEQIVTAHNYDPYGYRADGKNAVSSIFDACLVPMRQIQQLILMNPDKTDEQLQLLFNCDTEKPTLNRSVITAMRRAMEEAKI